MLLSKTSSSQEQISARSILKLLYDTDCVHKVPHDEPSFLGRQLTQPLVVRTPCVLLVVSRTDVVSFRTARSRVGNNHQRAKLTNEYEEMQ